jgi:hypothetical protein
VHPMLKVWTQPVAGRESRPPLRIVARPDPVSGASKAAAVKGPESHAPRSSTGTASCEPPESADREGRSRSRERGLLDGWREAHWALRLRLRDLMGLDGASEVERLYDLARRADNQLNDFYRARADALTKRLRDLLVERVPSQPIYDDRQSSRLVTAAAAPAPHRASPPRPSVALTLSERALLTRFRAMAPADRAAVLRVAQRLAVSASAPRC